MKKVTKHLFLVTLLILMINSSFPRISNAKILYDEVSPYLVETPSQHLLIYNKIGKDANRTVSSEIYVRPCYLTVTEFNTRDTEEVLITTTSFEAFDTSFTILKTDAIYFNGRVNIIFAAEEEQSEFVFFLLKYSEDDGQTWSEDFINLGNSTIEANDFVWFDTAILNNELFLAYSWKQRVIATIRIHTNMIHFNPSTYENTTNIIESSTSFGKDFNLYSYDNKLYVAYTEEKQVKFTYTLDGTTMSSGVSVDPPFKLDFSLVENIPSTVDLSEAEKLYPTIIRWQDGFYVIAQDISNTTLKKVNFYEYFLWGFWIQDIDKQDTITFYNISSPIYDTYYERTPTAALFENNIFLAFERGSSSVQSLQTPEVDFFFTKNGEKWTGNYMGDYTFLFNPATIFAAVTVVIFIFVFIVNFIISKLRKSEKK
ncbi:MAG: hypothetical protein ACTSQE_10190 [Candidatus Heimdallarchaeaceae archaeon]